MKSEIPEKKTGPSLFCWNIANPSLERAGRQAQWLRKREEDVLVLTEAKKSDGCLFLERYFQAYGYNVVFPKPGEREFGVMIVSKHPFRKNNFNTSIDYLQERVNSVVIDFPGIELEVIGIYAPSRDASLEKIEKKKRFLRSLADALAAPPTSPRRIVCGDFNVLEPNHFPRYPFFENWEYEFYQGLSKYGLQDAFRLLNPQSHEYSWVGRKGDGYRYDHCFISKELKQSLKGCYYFHEPREIEPRLSDHSALITEFHFVLS